MIPMVTLEIFEGTAPFKFHIHTYEAAIELIWLPHLTYQTNKLETHIQTNQSRSN